MVIFHSYVKVYQRVTSDVFVDMPQTVCETPEAFQVVNNALHARQGSPAPESFVARFCHEQMVTNAENAMNMNLIWIGSDLSNE